jgi:predicted kinase
VLLIGAAGSGKSTLAARLFARDEVLSSDDLRAELSGDPADQSVSGAAFRLLHARAAARLSAGQLTVVDATNVDRRARAPLLAIARSRRVPAVAIILDPPSEAIHARNRQRSERVVPEAVVRQQRARLRASIAGDEFDREGFELVVRLTDQADIDRLALARRPSPR